MWVWILQGNKVKRSNLKLKLNYSKWRKCRLIRTVWNDYTGSL